MELRWSVWGERGWAFLLYAFSSPLFSITGWLVSSLTALESSSLGTDCFCPRAPSCWTEWMIAKFAFFFDFLSAERDCSVRSGSMFGRWDMEVVVVVRFYGYSYAKAWMETRKGLSRYFLGGNYDWVIRNISRRRVFVFGGLRKPFFLFFLFFIFPFPTITRNYPSKQSKT